MQLATSDPVFPLPLPLFIYRSMCEVITRNSLPLFRVCVSECVCASECNSLWEINMENAGALSFLGEMVCLSPFEFYTTVDQLLHTREHAACNFLAHLSTASAVAAAGGASCAFFALAKWRWAILTTPNDAKEQRWRHVCAVLGHQLHWQVLAWERVYG